VDGVDTSGGEGGGGSDVDGANTCGGGGGGSYVDSIDTCGGKGTRGSMDGVDTHGGGGGGGVLNMDGAKSCGWESRGSIDGVDTCGEESRLGGGGPCVGIKDVDLFFDEVDGLES